MARYGINHPLDTINFTIMTIPQMRLAFSYQTLIGFTDEGWVLRENAWGPTTGKHLNYLNDNKKDRLSDADFNLAFMEATLKRLPTGEYV